MIKITKKLKYYYEVLYLEETYNIEKEVIYKYHLKDGLKVEKNKFLEIIKENEFYYYDRLSKNKLKRLLTTHELTKFLESSGANQELVNKLINNYLEFKYLDDDYYVKTYLEFKSHKEGPKLIKAKLLNKGIAEKLIDTYLNELDERILIANQIDSLINKYKNNNKASLSKKTKQSLINKGFNINLVNDITNEKLLNFEVDEIPLLKKEFNKLIKRYQNKYEGYELINKIKQNLFQKGYKINNIEEVIKSIDK